MGFRRIESFNKALLAKNIWRIIINPSSLVARVLKARYFKHQDMMKAKLGSNPSYIWRSLLWSRQLLNKELWWWVGIGRDIGTFCDNWIPGVRAGLGLGNQDFEKVNSLMQDQNWNINLVQNLFPHYIAQEILAIPIFTDLRQDSRYWIHDPKGNNSVRDGYKLGIGFFDSPSFCSELQVSKTWKFLWSLTLPPKVRILMEGITKHNSHRSQSEITSYSNTRIVQVMSLS